jgi:hypothetical protein
VSTALAALVPAGPAQAAQTPPPPVRIVEIRRAEENQPLLALPASAMHMGDVEQAFHATHTSHSSHSSHYSGHSSHSSHLSHFSSANPPAGGGDDDPYAPDEPETPTPKPAKKHKPSPKPKPKPNHETNHELTTKSPSPSALPLLVPLSPSPSPSPIETTESPEPTLTTGVQDTPASAVRQKPVSDSSSIGLLGKCCCFIVLAGAGFGAFAYRRRKRGGR